MMINIMSALPSLIAILCFSMGGAVGQLLVFQLPDIVFNPRIELSFPESVFWVIEKQLPAPPPEILIVEIDVPVNAKWFESKEELDTFLERIRSLRAPSISPNASSRGLCVYRARWLQELAINDCNRFISFQAGDWTGSKLDSDHGLCSTWVGRELYFFDPLDPVPVLVHDEDGWLSKKEMIRASKKG